jgi:Arc/MetJ-type ribon-helix-helix transcriptional regulator
MTQFVTRLDDDLAAAVDELVADGVVPSRSEAVRRGLAELVDRKRREKIGQAIVDGYTRMPQTDEEMAWAEASAKEMFEQESW